MNQDMTVQELIDRLAEMDPDLPVRVAHQPGHPLQLQLDAYEPLALRTDRAGVKSVYLLAKDQPYDAPYAPSGIFDGRLEDSEEDEDEGEA